MAPFSRIVVRSDGSPASTSIGKTRYTSRRTASEVGGGASTGAAADAAAATDAAAADAAAAAAAAA